ncbi:MAG: phytoene desaturase family protein, partial [Clostridium sp.]
IPNNKDEYKTLLINRFPLEKKGINDLFDDINKFDDGFTRFILNSDCSIFNKIHKNVLLFIKWSGKSTYDVLREYVKDDEFIRLFTALWMYHGLPPKDLSSLYFFIPWISYHTHGKYYIKGGAQALSNSFVNVIESNCGKVHLKSPVENILYEKDKVTGVKLKNGQEFKCKWVVSNANPISTYKMLPKDALNKKESHKIINFEIGCTLSQLYIGLDCNPSDINIPNDEIFFFEGSSHEEDYNLALNNKYSESGFLLTNYNSMDESLNSHKNGVLTMTYIDNYNYWSSDKEEYKLQKTKAKDEMILRLEKHYPGISDHIVVAELGTPRTMERYTKNPSGAVYGYSQSIKQAGRYRLTKKTSIKNLSLVGAWTNPGGGYEGAISGGIVEAHRIHKIMKNIK